MTTAMVFPGQGAHRPGMASAWHGHPTYATFDEVGRAAGLRDLATLADDPAACATTAIAQPAVFAAGVAAWRALTDAGVVPGVVAGHSLGELTAAVAAGVLSVADGAAVVAERGRAFADACQRSPGAMAAVLKLDRDAVDAVLVGHPAVVVANDNAPGQAVLAGPPDALEHAIAACRDAGGRVLPLDVEGAFHTSAMAPAVVRLAAVLRRHPLEDPIVPLIRGCDATPAVTAEQVQRGLVDGVLATVRWREVQQGLADYGATHLIEAGPGGVLRGLARRTLTDVEVSVVDDPSAVERLAVTPAVDELQEVGG